MEHFDEKKRKQEMSLYYNLKNKKEISLSFVFLGSLI